MDLSLVLNTTSNFISVKKLFVSESAINASGYVYSNSRLHGTVRANQLVLRMWHLLNVYFRESLFSSSLILLNDFPLVDGVC